LKNVLAVSDFHCGHKVGLTPPSQWYPRSSKLGKLQRAMWKGVEESIAGKRRPDVLLACGDLIDGKGKKSDSVEQLTTDLIEQADWATEIIKFINPKNTAIVPGTPYHVGSGTSYEKLTAEAVGAEFDNQLWIDVDGVCFNMKHKVGSSSIVHGRHTAISRAKWNLKLWEDRELVPESDIILRGHTHAHTHCGGPGWLAMILPALQGLGSKFGETQCEGLVDFGTVHFQVEKGEYTWREKTQVIKAQVKKAISLG